MKLKPSNMKSFSLRPFSNN